MIISVKGKTLELNEDIVKAYKARGLAFNEDMLEFYMSLNDEDIPMGKFVEELLLEDMKAVDLVNSMTEEDFQHLGEFKDE